MDGPALLSQSGENYEVPHARELAQPFGRHPDLLASHIVDVEAQDKDVLSSDSEIRGWAGHFIEDGDSQDVRLPGQIARACTGAARAQAACSRSRGVRDQMAKDGRPRRCDPFAAN